MKSVILILPILVSKEKGSQEGNMAGNYFVYISSWTNFGGTGGLAAYSMDKESGKLKYLKTYLENVSFGMSIFDEERNLLYVLNEAPDLPEAELDGGGGSIYIFRVDSKTGGLTEVQHCPSFGANPCYITIDREKKYLLIAHHASHAAVTHIRRGADGKYHILVDHDDVTLCLFPMNDDGTIGEPSDIVKHTGFRQSKEFPNAGMHTVCMDPAGDTFAVVDIGEARIHMYKIDREHGKLYEASAPFVDEHKSTPRYCLFHPKLPYFYVNHEMGSLDIGIFRYDGDGKLKLLGKTSSVPADHVWKYHDEQQDMRMHPNGKYIYDAVNGPDCIAVLEIDEASGMLNLIQSQKLNGKWARSCAISPDGRYLVATCLKSDDINIFSISDNGRLTGTEFHCKQSTPSWSVFCSAE